MRTLIDEAAAELDQAMAAAQRGDLEVTGLDLNELAQIRQELTLMRQAMSPSRYAPRYSWVITDRADYSWRLGNKLLDVAQRYERLK